VPRCCSTWLHLTQMCCVPPASRRSIVPSGKTHVVGGGIWCCEADPDLPHWPRECPAVNACSQRVCAMLKPFLVGTPVPELTVGVPPTHVAAGVPAVPLLLAVCCFVRIATRSITRTCTCTGANSTATAAGRTCRWQTQRPVSIAHMAVRTTAAAPVLYTHGCLVARLLSTLMHCRVLLGEAHRVQ
jgi:hypothetical protein